MRWIFVLAACAVTLSGCQTKPETPAYSLVDQQPGPYGLPSRAVMQEMLANPLTRPMAMQMLMDAQRIKMGLPPGGYNGNCAYDYNLDVRGNWCGARSAQSRPGGYQPY